MRTTADNYVQIRIKASDSARPDLTSLKADLDELGRKVETAKVGVDDADGKARLLAFNAKLATLNSRVANPRITVAGAARAEAEIAALDAQMKKADKDGASLKSRLLALGSTAGSVAGVGDAFGAFSKDASMASRVMSGFSLATGLLEAPMSGLIVGIGGLASGLAAAGAGILAFGAVAKSNFTVASTAANAVQNAQIAYNSAIATGTKQATAYRAEQKAILTAYAQLSPAQIQLSKQIGNAQNAWQSFVQSNTSGVAKVMTQGIGLLPKIFASMQPFMAPVEKALSGLVGQLGKGLDSSGWKSFVNMLASNAGPAITKLGTAIGHIGVGFGGIIRAFMPFAQVMLSGLDKITASFAHWGSTLTQHTGFQSLVQMAKQDMPYVMGIVKNLGGAIKNLASSMTGLSTFSNSKAILQLALPLSQLVDYLSKANPALLRMGLYLLAAGGAAKKIKPAFDGIKGGIDAIKGGVSAFSNLKAGFSDAGQAASEATGAWGTFGGKLSTAVTAVKNWGIWSKIASGATKIWTGIQAAFNLVMDANPIALIVIAIAALIAAIVLLTMHSKAFRDFWKRVWHDIASIFDTVRHAIAKGFDFITHAASAAFGWIKSHWPLLLLVLTGPVGIAIGIILALFPKLLKGVEHVIGNVASWFRRLPGMILSAVGDLGTLLWNAGASVIKGLIGGITSMVGSVGNAIGGIVNEIKSFLPFSPAKKGPLSGAGAPENSGRSIARLVARGIASGTPEVGQAMARMARTAGMAPGGYGGGYGAGASGKLQIELIMRGELLKLMQATVRQAGGDPAMFQRKVAFR